MKKRIKMPRLVLAVIAVMIIGSCGKENIRWIIGGHKYFMPHSAIKLSNGQWKGIKDLGFGFIDEIIFVRNDLMMDGTVTLIDSTYQTTDYSSYGGVYDQTLNCYSYNSEGIYVTYQRVEKMVFHYKWTYKSDRVMNIQFSAVDPLLNNVPGSVPLWKALSGDYVVEEDSRQKNQAYAGVVVVRKDDAWFIIKYDKSS